MACDVLWGNLSNVLQQYTQNVVHNMAFIISEEKKVSRDEVLGMWNEIAPDCSIGIKTKPKKTLDKICEYINKKKLQCANKVSLNSRTEKYCTKHIKQEAEKEPGEEDSSGESETSVASDKPRNKPIKPPSPLNKKSETKNSHPKFSIKFNRKAKLYMDDEYGFVFDRSTKSAYGKYQDGEVISLTPEDIQIINKYGLSYGELN